MLNVPATGPQKKGKVERPFNYIEEQFIKGNTFASMEGLNRRGKVFINGWCSRKLKQQHPKPLLPFPSCGATSLQGSENLDAAGRKF